MNLEEIIFFFVLFGIFGIALEVIFTSIFDLITRKKNRLMKGYSSLWMFFIYGSVYFIILLVINYFSDFNIFIRGLIYMFLIYTLEFCSGGILKKCKVIPWNYSNETKYHFKGIIRLEFAPIWFIGGLVAEVIYFYLKAHILF